MRANNEILTLHPRTRGREFRIGGRCARLYVAPRRRGRGREKHADAGNKKKGGEKEPEIFSRDAFSTESRVPCTYLSTLFHLGRDAYGRGKRPASDIYLVSRARGKSANNRGRLGDFPASGEKWLDPALIYHVSARVWTRRGLAGSSIVPRDAFCPH